MNRKGKYILLIILLLTFSGVVTFALYKTSKSVNGLLSSARWNINFKNGNTTLTNSFNINLSNANWSNNLGTVASGKIAPGSSTTFYITLDATNTETDVEYEVRIGDSFDNENFEVVLDNSFGVINYSEENNAMIRQIPIQVIWYGNVNDSSYKNASDRSLANTNISIPITITAAQKLPARPLYYNFGEVFVSDMLLEPPLFEDVYVTLYSDKVSKGVCLNKNDEINCFKYNNYDEEKTHIQQVFNDVICDDTDPDEVSCNNSAYFCSVSSDGIVYCYDKYNNHSCHVNSNGEECSSW